jgi:hypothetical protein
LRRAFKTRHFVRWMLRTALTDNDLCRAVAELESGLVDADLGGAIVKKRVALPGRGKSRGARVLVATDRNRTYFFLFGFEKNERTNVSAAELDALQSIAGDLLALSSQQLDALVASGALQEICHGQKAEGGQPRP